MKSTNIDIWVVGTLKQLFISDSKTETNFQKNKVVTDKSPLFVIDPFCSCFCSDASDRAVLNGNDVFSILMVSTEKWYCSFLKKVFVFQKM